MILTALLVSTINLVVYGTLVQRIHPDALKICAKYSFFVDLVFTGVIAGLAVATGSLTALIISSITGLFISLSLYLVKWYVGTAKVCFGKKINGKRGFYLEYTEATGGPDCLNRFNLKRFVTA